MALADGEHAQEEGHAQYGQERREDHAPSVVLRKPTAHGGTNGRCHGCDQRANAHHDAHVLLGRLLGDDVEHEGKRDTGAHALEDASAQKHGERDRGEAAHDAGNVEDHGGNEHAASAEAFVEIGRRGDNGGKNQQVGRGHPLDGRGGDVELGHERRERDVHGGLDGHA